MFKCRDLCLREGFKLSPHTTYFAFDCCRVCLRAYEKGLYEKCPCCKKCLSTKPRNSKLKQKYLLNPNLITKRVLTIPSS